MRRAIAILMACANSCLVKFRLLAGRSRKRFQAAAQIHLRYPPYCVEKLAFPSNGSNFSKSALSKPLFLLSHVSAETSGNPRYGVFQHNRPIDKQTPALLRFLGQGPSRPFAKRGLGPYSYISNALFLGVGLDPMANNNNWDGCIEQRCKRVSLTVLKFRSLC